MRAAKSRNLSSFSIHKLPLTPSRAAAMCSLAALSVLPPGRLGEPLRPVFYRLRLSILTAEAKVCLQAPRWKERV